MTDTPTTGTRRVREGTEAYCTACGWTDLWRTSDGSAQQSAAMHRCRR